LTANNGATEPDASALVAAMRARGIRFVVYRKRGSIDIVLRPYRLVTDADRATLRDHWDAVKAQVLAEEERAAAPCSVPAVTPIAPSASVAPTARRAPATADAAWFDVRGGKRVPIARFDPKKMDECLELVRRSAMRAH
jgi:hypothetical protein